MIKSYVDVAAEDILGGINSARARKLLPPKHWANAQFALQTLNNATSLDQVRAFQFFRLHKLKGKLDGWFSMDIARRVRLLFRYDSSSNEPYDITISPDHYGD